MRHNPNRIHGFSALLCHYNEVLAGFAAEEVDGVVFIFGFGVVGGQEHVGGVVDADNGVAFIVADVEAIDVVASEDDRLAVHGGLLALFGLVKAHYKFLEVDGAVARAGGAFLYTFLSVGLGHGQAYQEEYYGNKRVEDLHFIMFHAIGFFGSHLLFLRLLYSHFSDFTDFTDFID